MGTRCPHLLADSTHGTWGFAVDVPALGHRRTTVRRGGFTSQDSAEEALCRFLEGEAGGFDADPNQTVAAYLDAWLAGKALVLKPTTMARYRDYVRNDLVPAFDTLKLDQLAHRHITAFVTGQLAAGRGRTTLYRCLATFSSALGDAVRRHRLPHNPASPPVLRRPPSPERRIWTAEEGARFLTGMRKGEALGLHWDDVHLNEGVLYIRCTLSAIDNNRLVITTPKTRSSRGWIAISPRVATALRHRARSAPTLRGDPRDPLQLFAATRAIRSRGWSSAGPTAVRSGHIWCSTGFIGCPKKRASPGSRSTTCAISPPPSPSAGVPLTVVSKTLRHSTLSTTANPYSHLTQQAAHQAVDTIDHVLSGAQPTASRTDRPAWLRPPRDHLNRLHEALGRFRSPAPPATSTLTNQPQPGRATTLRPPRRRTHEKPPSHE
ncbi:tyrosine-type recombinase/integrase [Streptomyces sp. NPDC058486]